MDKQTAVVTSYQWGYVALSYAFAVLGSLIALAAATRIRRRDGDISIANTAAAGLALGGIGVWSMHFIGMVALRLDVGSSYAIDETVASLAAAVLGSSLALGFVARAPRQLPRLLLAGFLLGMGVVAMHYLGMHGMRIAGFIRWDLGLVALSAAIAVAAATAALWLAFNTRGYALRGAAAAVMGVAVCAMHHTGMSAAEFVCTSADRGIAPKGPGLVSFSFLPNVVAFGAMMIAGLIVVQQLYQASREDLDELDGLQGAAPGLR